MIRSAKNDVDARDLVDDDLGDESGVADRQIERLATRLAEEGGRDLLVRLGLRQHDLDDDVMAGLNGLRRLGAKLLVDLNDASAAFAAGQLQPEIRKVRGSSPN